MSRDPRIAQVDENVRQVTTNLTPQQLQPWEIERAIRQERDMLRLRVAELEGQLDECIDAMVGAELRSTPSSVPKRRGRPPGKKDSRKRKPKRKKPNAT